MQPDQPPLCDFCSQDFNPGFFTCKAFPRGVPTEIVMSTFDHRKEHPDDNGTQFGLAFGQGDRLKLWDKRVRMASNSYTLPNSVYTFSREVHYGR